MPEGYTKAAKVVAEKQTGLVILKTNSYSSPRRALFVLFCRFPNRSQLREEIVRDVSIDAGWRDVPSHSATLVRNALREGYHLIRLEAGRFLAP